jgi:hypothetical protein
MSMMMRRSATGREQFQEQGADLALDPRFPEATGVTPQEIAPTAIHGLVTELAAQRFNGYLHLGSMNSLIEAGGVMLLRDGAPIGARTTAADGARALIQLLTPQDAAPLLYAAHPLSEEATLALAATFHPPQLTQPLGNDSGEVAMLLRELTGVRHSGVIQIGARGARPQTPLWARILLHEGKILGVYSAQDRYPKASLAEVTTVLVGEQPQLALFTLPATLNPLSLPLRAVAPPADVTISGTGATAARDEVLETDLVWFMSRFERAFGRLRERRDPQADLLRAFGELTNELAGFVAGLQGAENDQLATRAVVEAELQRARAGGNAMIDLQTGGAGLDAVLIARCYGSFQRRSGIGAAYFKRASNDMLTLMGRLMERMIGAFRDPVTAGLTREAGETLLREVRDGLGPLA